MRCLIIIACGVLADCLLLLVARTLASGCEADDIPYIVQIAHQFGCTSVVGRDQNRFGIIQFPDFGFGMRQFPEVGFGTMMPFPEVGFGMRCNQNGQRLVTNQFCMLCSNCMCLI